MQIFARAPFHLTYVPIHHSGAYTFLCSISVPICFRAPFQCLNVSGHSCGAQNWPGTFRCPYVPGQHSGANICLGTFPKPICAWEPLWCPYVIGHPYGALMYSGTFQVYLCAQVLFHCPYVPGLHYSLHSGFHMFPCTLRFPICDRAPFR